METHMSAWLKARPPKQGLAPIQIEHQNTQSAIAETIPIKEPSQRILAPTQQAWKRWIENGNTQPEHIMVDDWVYCWPKEKWVFQNDDLRHWDTVQPVRKRWPKPSELGEDLASTSDVKSVSLYTLFGHMYGLRLEDGEVDLTYGDLPDPSILYGQSLQKWLHEYRAHFYSATCFTVAIDEWGYGYCDDITAHVKEINELFQKAIAETIALGLKLVIVDCGKVGRL